ncbi:acyl carrier protein [Streptomyces sp. NBC_00249]|uniref:acyl carrier protein n=1 Tax=Streptomyces sp. NBC_00249 TaxID=2975690 RepID=UPI00224CFB5F|nr:acyl carrier protein [Streptomyces sp. NBC_00249]MCX5199533.1 acyl carrier protein [Streptomyces sp. NBC_00249]
MTPDRCAVVTEPDGDVREFMIKSWSELLGASGLTEHSDFFARGGDSLLMTRLVRRIGERFGVTVSLSAMSQRNLGDQVRLVHSLRPRSDSARASRAA